jgi:branched-chain amino acid transport system permease protein
MSHHRSPVRRALTTNRIGVLALAGGLILIGFVGLTPLYLTTLNLSIITAIAAIGLTLLFGYTGLASLGQAAFFGIGAYTAANVVERLGAPPLLALAAAPILSALVAWIVARPLLSLSGNYLTMATMAFGIVMHILFSQLRTLTGGLDPGLTVRPFRVGTLEFSSTLAMFWLCAACLVVSVWAATNLVNSPYGRACRALKSSRAASEGVGIPTAAYKATIFALAAAYAGLAGALYAFFARAFNASSFGFSYSIELLIVCIVGSMRSVWGALFGALLLTVLPNVLEGFNDYKLFVYGLIMVAIMMFMPEGLFHGLVEFARRSQRAKAGS